MFVMINQSETIYIFTVSVIVPVDGGWGEWSEWSTCSVTCAGGDQSRTRQCDNPVPQHNGDDCSVDGSRNTETRSCTEIKCPGKSNFKLQYSCLL